MSHNTGWHCWTYSSECFFLVYSVFLISRLLGLSSPGLPSLPKSPSYTTLLWLGINALLSWGALYPELPVKGKTFNGRPSFWRGNVSYLEPRHLSFIDGQVCCWFKLAYRSPHILSVWHWLQLTFPTSLFPCLDWLIKSKGVGPTNDNFLLHGLSPCIEPGRIKTTKQPGWLDGIAKDDFGQKVQSRFSEL